MRPSVYDRTKRLLDVVVAGAVLVGISPLLVLLAGLVRTALGRGVLFRQVRPGHGGQPFVLVKFRSMAEGRDAQGRPLPDDQRLTRFGAWLRSTSLDELPELWNVLRGDMSLVGPRPLLMEYLGRYTPEQYRRHEVLPGLTGWAQVRGRNALTWEDKFALDLWYVDNRSLWLDVKILLMTVWKIVTREGVRQPGHATAEDFMGSPSSQRPNTETNHQPVAASPHSCRSAHAPDSPSVRLP